MKHLFIILCLIVCTQISNASESIIKPPKSLIQLDKDSEEKYRVDDYVIKNTHLTCDIDEDHQVTIYEAAQILRGTEILLSVLFSFDATDREFKDDYLNNKLKEAFFALSTRGYYLMADNAFDKMSTGILEPNHLYRAYFLFKNILLPENILALSCIR